MRADAVADAKDTPRADRRRLCRGDRFHRKPAAEEHRQPLIHDKERLPVALLVEHADMRLLQPRRHLPVDRADVVAGTIVPDLLEIQAAAAHARGEPPGQQAVNRLPRQERYLASSVFEPDQILEIDIDTGHLGFDISHGTLMQPRPGRRSCR